MKAVLNSLEGSTNLSFGYQGRKVYTFQYQGYPIGTSHVTLESGRGTNNELNVRLLSDFSGCPSEGCRDHGRYAMVAVDCKGEGIEMKSLLLSLGVVCFAAVASATTVQYTLTATGNPNEYTYLFTSNASLAQNQGLVIKFPGASYTNGGMTSGVIENPIGGTGFNLFLHQPNNPSGVAGDLTMIRSLAGAASLSEFRVTAVGNGSPLSSLPFEIIQFDGSTGSANVLSTLETGTANLSGVPEPGSALLSIVGMVATGLYLNARRC